MDQSKEVEVSVALAESRKELRKDRGGGGGGGTTYLSPSCPLEMLGLESLIQDLMG